MRDATARGHPVDLAGVNGLLEAEAVAMRDLAFEQVRHGRKADVRMRAYIDAARNARRKIHRTHVIEEHERPDHAPLRVRQHPSDFEAAEILAPLSDHHVQHVFALA